MNKYYDHIFRLRIQYQIGILFHRTEIETYLETNLDSVMAVKKERGWDC